MSFRLEHIKSVCPIRFSNLISHSNISTAAHTLAAGTRSSSAMQLPDVSNVIFKIEDATPSLNLPGDYEPIPHIVNMKRVYSHLTQTYRNNKERLEVWSKYYFSIENLAVISDFFWLAVCRIVHKGRYLEQEEILLNRISHNYMVLFSNVAPKDKSLFFKNYYDTLAQSVFYCLFFAFPKSRSRILSEEFKNSFYNIVSQEVTGIPLAEPPYKKWVLDLGSGNILSDTLRPVSTEMSSGKENKSIIAVNLRYTPLMERYMKSRNYEGYNKVPPRRLKLSQKDRQNDARSARRMNSFVKFAKESVSRTMERFNDYEDYSSKLRQKLHKNHLQTLSHAKLLTAYTDRVLRTNAHEYSNKLVSLPKELQCNNN